MASKRKPAAAKAVATPEAEVPPVVAETVVDGAATETNVEAPTEAAVPSMDSSDAALAAEDGDSTDSEAEVPSVWPRRYRLTNNTRMPLSLPASYIEVAPFGKHSDFSVADQGVLANIQCEIDTIAGLNGLDASVFVLEPIQTEGE